MIYLITLLVCAGKCETNNWEQKVFPCSDILYTSTKEGSPEVRIQLQGGKNYLTKFTSGDELQNYINKSCRKR